ncbi:hypothetical protein G3N94_37175, partial [Burkholderia sp. Ac-20353]|nr:hypothetical protein [Burkholderia sp. Ac-20353]
MTTFAMRKRRTAAVGGRVAQPSRTTALAIGMLLLIAGVALACAVRPDAHAANSASRAARTARAI